MKIVDKNRPWAVMKTQGSLPFMARYAKKSSVEDKDKEPRVVMGQDDKMARLEMFVEKLIGNFSELKKEHIDLQNRFRELQQENQENQASIASLQNDRNVMRDRVGGLIDRIEEWESTLAADHDSLAFAEQLRAEEEQMVAGEKTFRMGVE